MITDPPLVSVGDLADLVHDAFELINGLSGQYNETGIPEVDVQNWLVRFRLLSDQLSGNRRALEAQVFEALRAVGSVSDEQISATLMAFIDNYADSLPLVRPAYYLDLPEDDPAETLARALFTISARISERSAVATWDDAPDDLRRVLRETAIELIRLGLVDRALPPLQTVQVDDGLTDQVRERLAEVLRQEGFGPLSDTPIYPGKPNTPPEDQPYSSYCVTGCTREDFHDGRNPGACTALGKALMPLPPPIRMPPGFNPEDRNDPFLDLPGAPSEGEV